MCASRGVMSLGMYLEMYVEVLILVSRERTAFD